MGTMMNAIHGDFPDGGLFLTFNDTLWHMSMEINIACTVTGFVVSGESNPFFVCAHDRLVELQDLHQYCNAMRPLSAHGLDIDFFVVFSSCQVAEGHLADDEEGSILAVLHVHDLPAIILGINNEVLVTASNSTK